MTPYHYPNLPAPKKRNVGLIVFLSVVGLIVVACGLGTVISLAAGPPSDADTIATVPAPKPSPQRSQGSKATPQKAAARSVGEGMWSVGTDIPAGTYKTAGAQESVFQFCTWSVRTGEDADSEVIDFGTSDKTNKPGRVLLKKGHIFETSGCQKWVKQ